MGWGCVFGIVGGMAKNLNLHNAKRVKKDEFYTQWEDVEREMTAYLDYNPDVFKGKTILLPCDDPGCSNFTKFFMSRFQEYGVKKLISTSYAVDGGRGKILIFDGEGYGEWGYLQGDGDFRSDEVTALRDEADMVITNPPFSVFREFMVWLVEGGVEFSVIGNMNAITYEAIFPLIKGNEVWLGYGKNTGGNSMWFEVPVTYPVKKNEKITNEGSRVVPVTSKWFTNIKHGRRCEHIPLMTMDENIRTNKRIINNPNSYKSYDNYEAIEVPVTAGIPSDYEGVMGVPISFLNKHNPDQFEILGCSFAYGRPEGWSEDVNMSPSVDGGEVYKRVLIRNKRRCVDGVVGNTRV